MMTQQLPNVSSQFSRVADSIIPECPHKAHCINCGGSHAASSHKCKFWDHRFDQQWINAKYAEVRQQRLDSRNNSNNLRPLA